MKGGMVCHAHGGKAPQVRAKADVRAELENWGLTDELVNPDETLLKLVSQSARRVNLYAALLQDAFDAAERLRQAHEAGELLVDGDEATSKSLEQAQMDLDRIFTTGGVGALIGYRYGAAGKEGYIYRVGEDLRGLADLEMKERELCAKFSSKAIAAGIAERQVRLAERQEDLAVAMLRAALNELDLPPQRAQEVMAKALVKAKAIATTARPSRT
jgi:hypothetical protein